MKSLSLFDQTLGKKEIDIGIDICLQMHSMHYNAWGEMNSAII